jgi:hypothetical protein
MTASGVDLATGSLTVVNPANGSTEHHGGSPDWPVLVALLLVAGGIAACFVSDRLLSMRLVLAASIASLFFCYFGYRSINTMLREGASSGQYQQLDQAVLASLKVEPRFGFYLTMLALAASSGASAFSLFGKEALQSARQRGLTVYVPGLNEGNADNAFWDRIDKTDEDSLREYLIRFPSGRFVELAKLKLSRLTSTPAPSQMGAGVPAPTTLAQRTCEQCQSDIEPSNRFCTRCGAPAPQMS